MSKPSAPAAPDPAATIAAQSQANTQSATQTAELNRINQNTPYGSLSYTTDGTYPDGTPMYTQNETLSPSQQNLFNLGQQGAQTLGQTGVNMLGQVQSSYANPIDYSGAPGIASNAGKVGQQQYLNSSSLPTFSNSINNTGPSLLGNNYNQQIGQAENAAYNQQAQYLNPQFSQAQEALSNSLINQGITQGSQAANTAQQNLGLQENQAYGNAADQAVQAGQTEQNTLFGQNLSANQQGFNQGLAQTNLSNTNMQQSLANLEGLTSQNNAAQNTAYGQGLSSADLQNSAQSQYLQQLYAMQNQPLNEYNALATGSQVTQPNFSQFAQSPVAATNASGIINQGYQNQLSAYQQQMAGINNLFSLGGSLGSAAILA